MNYRNTRAEIYLNHLRHNLEVLKQLHSGHPFFCPMVKANAYGHGDVEVSTFLQEMGVENFGVVLVEEGLRLRENGVLKNILVFGTFTRDSLEVAAQSQLIPIISGWDQFELLKSIKSKTNIHIKFNTGMNRLGFDIEDSQKILDLLPSLSNINLKGVCTHFHSAEDSDSLEGQTENQLKKFEIIQRQFQKYSVDFHCLNSAALLLGASKRYKLGARPGITVYGIQPNLNKKIDINFKPLMEIKSFIGQLHRVKRGDSVSYGATWKADSDSIIATVPIGYADGYPRQFSGKSHMLFRGRKVPLVGIVCMDYVMLDLTEFKNEKEISVGEEVVVFGRQNQTEWSSQMVAAETQSHPYELVTRIGQRIPRVYIK